MQYVYLRSFVGCELSKDKKEYKWDSEDEELSKTDIEQKLVVTQVIIIACARVYFQAFKYPTSHISF